MRVFLDSEGKANYDRIDESDRVSSLLDAVDAFLSLHPLSCSRCGDSCCRKQWSVEVDNVYVNSLAGADRDNRLSFIRNRLQLKKNYRWGFKQFVLKKDGPCPHNTPLNRCLIYKDRPVICRLYICCEKSLRYNMLREMVGSVYLTALLMEYRLERRRLSPGIINMYRRNPAVFADGYGIPLSEILDYAVDTGWLDDRERQMLCAPL